MLPAAGQGDAHCSKRATVMTTRSGSSTAQISFEVYVQRDGRWLVADVFEDQAAALEYAEGLRQRRDLGGIKVVRETYDPERDESYERVIFDSGIDLPKPPPEAPGASPRPRAHRAAEPEPRQRRGTAPARKGFPWVKASFSGIGLLVAVAGALISVP